MNRKLISMLMALAMVAALAIPTLAAEDTAAPKDSPKATTTPAPSESPAPTTSAQPEAVLPADVPADAWYMDAAKFVLGNGMMKGTDKGFEGTGTVTRAIIYQILYNMEGKPTAGLEKAAFNDLKDKWYSDAAHWAAFIGIAAGKADGSFGGDDTITRGELAKIIADYAKMKDVKVDTTGMAMKEAPDYAKIPAEYLEGMTFCYYGNIMVGDKDGNLNPEGSLTRAELAQVMLNYSKVPVPLPLPAETPAA